MRNKRKHTVKKRIRQTGGISSINYNAPRQPSETIMEWATTASNKYIGGSTTHEEKYIDIINKWDKIVKTIANTDYNKEVRGIFLSGRINDIMLWLDEVYSDAVHDRIIPNIVERDENKVLFDPKLYNTGNEEINRDIREVLADSRELIRLLKDNNNNNNNNDQIYAVAPFFPPNAANPRHNIQPLQRPYYNGGSKRTYHDKRKKTRRNKCKGTWRNKRT